MIQIEKEKCTPVGFIQKPHGLKGEVLAVIDPEFEELLDSVEKFFIEIEGGLVPYFVSDDGLKYKNNESIIVKFDYLDSQEKAREIAGCKLYVSNDELLEADYPEIYDSFIGMNVFDEKSGELGTITALDDYSGNIVITVSHPKGEILIPLSDEIIQKVDVKKKRIYLDCPEGLIDIYLE